MAKDIRRLLTESRCANLAVAGLITDARSKFFGDNCLAWQEWCQREFGFNRRHCFRLYKITNYLRDANNKGVDISATLCTDLLKLECLFSIPVESLLKFLKDNDLENLDREELRVAVAKFLHREHKGNNQADFFSSLGLPPIKRLANVLNADGLDIDGKRAGEYGIVFLCSAMKHQETLSGNDQAILSKRVLGVARGLYHDNLDRLIGDFELLRKEQIAAEAGNHKTI